MIPVPLWKEATQIQVFACDTRPCFVQVEDWDPFIDTLDYIFHTSGITATKVQQ